MGEVQLFHPFEDDPIYAPLSVDTEEEFEDWVEKHREPVMQKLSLENYFNVWVSVPGTPDMEWHGSATRTTTRA